MGRKNRIRPRCVWPPPCLGRCAIVLGLLAGCSKDKTATSVEQGPPRPNIILISLESLRADHVGCYGYGRDTTPALDTLAKQATLYENAYSVTSWTLPAHASLFTGLYPSAHHVTRPKDSLNDSHETLAEILAEHGYQTAAVLSGPFLKSVFHLNQGFQIYDEHAMSPPMVNAHDDVTNPRMEARVNDFLEKTRSRERPFFLLLYYWDPHYQYVPPSPYDRMFIPATAREVKNPRFEIVYKLNKHIFPDQVEYLKGLYDGEIRCTNEYLKRLFDRLRALGLWDDTAIVLTADHGEQFYEHGGLGHKYDLYEESLHVPLLVKAPGQKAAARDPRIVNTIDLFPTILDMARCPIPAQQQGRSLLADPRTMTDPVFHELVAIWYLRRMSTGEQWEETENWFAVREGDYKLVWQENKGLTQLYNLVDDPGELRPLTAGHEAFTAQLKARIDEWRLAMKKAAGAGPAPSAAPLSPEEEARLRSLGYLGEPSG